MATGRARAARAALAEALTSKPNRLCAATLAVAEGETAATAGDFAAGLNPTVDRRAGVSGAAADDEANDDERATLEEAAAENDTEALKEAPARIMRSSEGVLIIEKGRPAPSVGRFEFVTVAASFGVVGAGASAAPPD